MVLAGLVVTIVYPSMAARKVGTFQTSVVDKLERRSVIYSGIFVPVLNQYLVVDMGIEVKVKKYDYGRIDIGNTIYVSKYSNGSYRLEQ